MHNLTWKINLVEKGIGRADKLLPTYETERRGVAQQLIKFDSEYSKLFSGRSPNANELTADEGKATKKLGAVDAQKFIEVGNFASRPFRLLIPFAGLQDECSLHKRCRCRIHHSYAPICYRRL